MLTKFIKTMGLFLCFNILIILGFITFYILIFGITISDIPPANISNSASFNAKMEFIRKSKKDKKIIAIGSSLSLNNLYSESIINAFHSDSFINAASWGSTMKDDYLLIRLLTKIYKPNTFIIASNIKNFQAVEKTINYSLIVNYLNSSGLELFLYHLKTFNLSYYFNGFKDSKRFRIDKNDYYYLGFDNYGTVNFDSTKFHIDPYRWNDANFVAGISSEYSYLDSIAAYCKFNNIKLYFFQSPYRKGLVSNFGQEKIDLLKSHLLKLEKILKKHDQILINSTEAIWDDRLFVDAFHLNKYGAKNFTDFCLKKIEQP